MKNQWRFASLAILSAQLSTFSIRAEETNTLEIIKQLQRRIEELEQKVKTLEQPKPPAQDEREKQRLEDLDKKVKELERERERERETAEARQKSPPKVSMTDEGFSGFFLGPADKAFALN